MGRLGLSIGDVNCKQKAYAMLVTTGVFFACVVLNSFIIDLLLLIKLNSLLLVVTVFKYNILKGIQWVTFGFEWFSKTNMLQ